MEATATGNILVQAIKSGQVADENAARKIVRDSSETEAFTPCPSAAWREAQDRFAALIQR